MLAYATWLLFKINTNGMAVWPRVLPLYEYRNGTAAKDIDVYLSPIKNSVAVVLPVLEHGAPSQEWFLVDMGQHTTRALASEAGEPSYHTELFGRVWIDMTPGIGEFYTLKPPWPAEVVRRGNDAEIRFNSIFYGRVRLGLPLSDVRVSLAPAGTARPAARSISSMSGVTR